MNATFLRGLALLAVAAATACNEPPPVEETVTDDLRTRCLSRFDDDQHQPQRAELTRLMDDQVLTPRECGEFGDQLDSIERITAGYDEQLEPSVGLVFEGGPR